MGILYELRPFQKSAIHALKSSCHLICVSPTGSGKSLIYEQVILQSKARTLLVTPLVALARQQAAKLAQAGVKTLLSAGNPHSSDPQAETEAWIISPESLRYEPRRRALKNWKPEFLVVDECHCLWDWGEDFRPAFYHLPELIHEHLISKSLWLTATLPLEARSDLKSRLPQKIVEIGDFELPKNLSVQIFQVPLFQRISTLMRWLDNQNGPGIIFVNTRDDAQRLAGLLLKANHNAVFYHAGLSQEERRSLEAAVRANLPQIVVATSAFGMGMDYPHLEWVVLWQAPLSLLALAQTIGRVARSTEKIAKALVLWDEEDFRLLEWALQSSSRKKKQLLDTLRFLRSRGCRRLELKRFFEKEIQRNETCEKCDYCNQPA